MSRRGRPRWTRPTTLILVGMILGMLVIHGMQRVIRWYLPPPPPIHLAPPVYVPRPSVTA